MVWFRKTIQINFKSGQTMFVKAKEFKLLRCRDGSIKEIEWEDVRPAPLMFLLSEIESIWVL